MKSYPLDISYMGVYGIWMNDLGEAIPDILVVKFLLTAIQEASPAPDSQMACLSLILMGGNAS